MGYLFAARAVAGVFARGRADSYAARAGSFTITAWPDGTTRFGAPTEIAWLTEVEQLPDIVNLPYLCVSARVRDLIDCFEPGVHAFYPVSVTLPNGRVDLRHLLHVTQTIDAVSPEHSNWEKTSGVLWQEPPGRDKRLVFDARRIRNAHLWVNEGLRTEMRYLASDALAQAAEAAGITGLLLERMEQTAADGSYAPPPPARQVWAISQLPRIRPNGAPVLVKAKLLDGTARAIHFAEPPRGDPMRIAGAVRHGRWLDPANVPTRAHYHQNVKGHAPDLYGHGDLPLTVSERMRDLIEVFEPGVHQFLPVAFEDKKGAVTERRHLLVIGARLDTGSSAHSTMLAPDWYNPGGEQGRVRVARAAVAGRHLWRDRYLPAEMIISDALAAAIEARGWPDLRFGGYELVD